MGCCQLIVAGIVVGYTDGPAEAGGGEWRDEVRSRPEQQLGAGWRCAAIASVC